MFCILNKTKFSDRISQALDFKNHKKQNAKSEYKYNEFLTKQNRNTTS